MSSSAVATGASSPLPSSSDERLPKLHASALSPQEYPQYVKWVKEIQISPSGVEGLLDEQDALAWLRRECAIGRVDEIKVSLLPSPTNRSTTSPPSLLPR